MQYKGIHILSTRPLDQSLIQQAAEKNIVVEVQSLITIKAVTDNELQAAIIELASQPVSVAITSINAAKAVAACLHGLSTKWEIFTIGTATKNYISDHFGNHCIAGTASNASLLADIIIARQVKDLIFFCGNQRRDELPGKLGASDVEVREIVVYKTLYAASKTDRLYDGILFFSPGAVQSFFSANTTGKNAVLFAIGATTAESISVYSNNPVIVSAVPSAEALVDKAINHFANTNIFHDGTSK